jgi:solute carrier family 30 (zinc transporter), member 1
VKETALVLLQTVPKEIEIKQLRRELLENVAGISSIHQLHIWRLHSDKIIATAHIMCHNPRDYAQLGQDIKEFFHSRGIHFTTIQLEFKEVNKINF